MAKITKTPQQVDPHGLRSPCHLNFIGSISLGTRGVFKVRGLSTTKHFPSRLSDHGPVIDAKSHIRGKELAASLFAHLLHHLL